MGVFSTSLRVRLLNGDDDIQGSYPSFEELQCAIRNAARSFSNEELLRAIDNNSGAFLIKPILQEELNRRLFK